MGGSPPRFDPDELRGRAAANVRALRDGGPVEQELEARGIDVTTRRTILEQFRQGDAQFAAHHDVERALAAARNAPTPYVDPFHHTILSKLDSRIANLGRRQPQLSFARELQNLRGRVTVSTLPLGQVNARTFSVPATDEYLILFDPVFLDFLYALSVDIAGAIDTNKALQGARRQVSAPEPVDVSPAIRYGDPRPARSFFSTLSAFLHWGAPPAPHPNDHASLALAEHLRETATQFILAHEYAHVLLGHVSADAKPGIDGGAVRRRTVQQELDADWLACSILDAVVAGHGNFRPTEFMGPHFFFVAATLAELGIRAIQTGTPRHLVDLLPTDETQLGDTHPVAALRIRNIDHWAATKLPQELVRPNAYLEALLLQVGSSLWDNVQQHVLGMRTKGFEAPTLWNSLDVFEGPELEMSSSRADAEPIRSDQQSSARGGPRCPRCGQEMNMELYAAQQALHVDAVRDECRDCDSLLLISLGEISVTEM
jgi:hypothetical protein